jgi:dolichol-phosphate mannosyltransferase
MKKISIVIPAHNEEKNIVVLFEEIKSCFDAMSEKYDWELIFVDDGSRDNTVEVIKALIGVSRIVRLIQLSRNFGHQAALMAGLAHCVLHNSFSIPGFDER